MASVVAHAGALGDFITCLPALDAWRFLHAEEPLILLGKPAYATLAAPPGFAAVWDVERARFAFLFSGAAPGDGEAPRGLRDVTSALLFATAASPLVRSFSAAGVKEIMRQDPFPPTRIPIVDYHLSFFPPAIAAAAGLIPRVMLAGGIGKSSRVIALQPGSGSPKKNWPLDRFSMLATELKKRGESVVWVLGPAEDAMAVPSDAPQWRGLELPTLAARLAGCRCYVGNDSGITHLAAAAGCPTIALFGASDSAIWAPRGRHVRTLCGREGNVKNITVNEVVETLRGVLMIDAE
jgi:heptosyltransferase III